MSDNISEEPISKADAFRTFGKIGLLSFGGPAAQIALMHKVLVDEKKWLTEQQYLNALSFCMLLPGPEAMQLATYSGWKHHGVIGGLIAGLLFVLPGAFVIMALAAIYGFYGNVELVQALFLGVKATVLIIVIEALLKVSKRALKEVGHWIIAGLAFVGIFFVSIPFPIIIIAAALYGFFIAPATENGGRIAVASNRSVKSQSVKLRTTLKTIMVWLAIWIAPVLALDLMFDMQILRDIGLLFAKMAVVSFGGAYALLAYMAQDVVSHLGWLSADEMMDALGLAETTPGPLILVTQFVAFLAGFKEGGLWLGMLGAIVALWVTFAPCFLWIFAGAPYIEWMSAQPRLKGALSAITASIVGVMLNLSIWFGLHVLFGDVRLEEWNILTLWVPDLKTVNWLVLALSILAGVLMFRLHVGLIKVLGLSAGLSLVVSSIL